MRRLLYSTIAIFVLTGFLAVPDASAQSSINFLVGGFVPRGFSSRAPDDVIANDINCYECFAVNVSDFNGATFGGEWLFGLGELFEGGIGAGYYQQSVPSIYTNFTNANGSEIEQTLKLRIVPFTATVRFLPLGRKSALTPYVGGGLGAYSWHYSESGNFIDFSTPRQDIISGTFEGSGSAVGPVVLGGVRVPVGAVGLGGEIRYQWAKGDLPTDQGFAGGASPTIDLGGFTYLFVINVKF